MLRIDTHHHVILPDHRKALQHAGLLEAGGRALDLIIDGLTQAHHRQRPPGG